MFINFKKLADWFLSFFRKAGEFLQEPAAIAVRVVNILKDYIANPVVDFITMLTRTDIDDRVVEQIRLYFPGVIKAILLGERIVEGLVKADMASLIRTLSEYLGRLSKEAKGRWWAELAAQLLTILLPKGEVTLAVARPATSVAYYNSIA